MLRDRMQEAFDAARRRAIDLLAVAVILGFLACFLVQTWPTGAEVALLGMVFALAVWRCADIVFRGRS